MNRPARVVRWTATGIGAGYAVVLWRSGVHISGFLNHVIAYFPAISVVLVVAWDLWLWRQWPIHRFCRRPLIHGAWQATLQPSNQSHIPEDGNRGAIEAYVIMSQSYWSLGVRMLTAESKSSSIASVWSDQPDGQGRTLTYTYVNEPSAEVEHRSSLHYGTTSLGVIGRKPTLIEGQYFTDRYTKGDMHLTFCDRSTDHPSFTAAQRHCAAAPRPRGRGRGRITAMLKRGESSRPSG